MLKKLDLRTFPIGISTPLVNFLILNAKNTRELSEVINFCRHSGLYPNPNVSIQNSITQNILTALSISSLSSASPNEQLAEVIRGLVEKATTPKEFIVALNLTHFMGFSAKERFSIKQVMACQLHKRLIKEFNELHRKLGAQEYAPLRTLLMASSEMHSSSIQCLKNTTGTSTEELSPEQVLIMLRIASCKDDTELALELDELVKESLLPHDDRDVNTAIIDFIGVLCPKIQSNSSIVLLKILISMPIERGETPSILAPFKYQLSEELRDNDEYSATRQWVEQSIKDKNTPTAKLYQIANWAPRPEIKCLAIEELSKRSYGSLVDLKCLHEPAVVSKLLIQNRGFFTKHPSCDFRIEVAAEAMQCGQIGIFGQIVESDIDLSNALLLGGHKSSKTLLHMACAQNNLLAIRFLIKAGADPHIIDAYARKPSDYLPAIKPVVQKEELLNPRRFKQCELFEKIARGSKTAVKELVDSDYDINEQIQFKKRTGCTALHVACASGNRSAIQALLNAKAKLEVKDSKGRTPLAYASLNGKQAVFEQLTPQVIKAISTGDTSTLEKLLNAGFPSSSVINYRNGSFFSLINLACKEGHSQVVELLLQHGGKCHVKDSSGKTAIDYALEKRNPDIIDRLEVYLGRKL